MIKELYICGVHFMHELAFLIGCEVSTLAVVVFFFLVPTIILVLLARCCYLGHKLEQNTCMLEDMYSEEIYSHDKEEEARFY